MRFPIRIILINLVLSIFSSIFVCFVFLVYAFITPLKDKLISWGLLIAYLMFTILVNAIYFRKSKYIKRLDISAFNYALTSGITLLVPYILFFGISILAGLIMRLMN